MKKKKLYCCVLSMMLVTVSKEVFLKSAEVLWNKSRYGKKLTQKRGRR